MKTPNTRLSKDETSQTTQSPLKQIEAFTIVLDAAACERIHEATPQSTRIHPDPAYRNATIARDDGRRLPSAFPASFMSLMKCFDPCPMRESDLRRTFQAIGVNLIPIAIFAATAFLTACDKTPANAPTTSETAPPNTTLPAESRVGILPEIIVVITANDQMKFDPTAIEAKPGQRVTVTLRNVGMIPKSAMAHNFVLLKPDVDTAQFVVTGLTHTTTEFIAPEMSSHVIASTKLLGPGESDTISFTTPKEQGAYNYICSFPGHYAAGMKGVLTVK